LYVLEIYLRILKNSGFYFSEDRDITSVVDNRRNMVDTTTIESP